MQQPADPLSPSLPPPEIRYIKLGSGDRWAKRSIECGEIHFGHSPVSHDLALSGDRQAIVEHYLAMGRTPSKAADFAREVLDFYSLGPETIWITFLDGRLWWATANRDVVWIGETETSGARLRRTIEKWRNADVLGRPLLQAALSTRLTKVAAYRQTLCKVDAAAYLLRKLRGEDDPAILEAMKARTALIFSASGLIAGLHWADFETLVDLLLARSGWHRTSMLGGTMKDADLIVEQTITDETALVQVKSSASQRVLDDYLLRFDANPAWSRLIFVCHSPKGTLSKGDRPEVIIWDREALADAAVRNGLFDWLVARAT